LRLEFWEDVIIDSWNSKQYKQEAFVLETRMARIGEFDE